MPAKALHLATGSSSRLRVTLSERLLRLALVNPYNAEQDVAVEVIGPGLEVKRQEHVLLPANGQKIFYLAEAVGIVKAPDWVRIRGTWPVAVSAISIADRATSLHAVWH